MLRSWRTALQLPSPKTTPTVYSKQMAWMGHVGWVQSGYACSHPSSSCAPYMPKGASHGSEGQLPPAWEVLTFGLLLGLWVTGVHFGASAFGAAIRSEHTPYGQLVLAGFGCILTSLGLKARAREGGEQTHRPGSGLGRRVWMVAAWGPLAGAHMGRSVVSPCVVSRSSPACGFMFPPSCPVRLSACYVSLSE